MVSAAPPGGAAAPRDLRVTRICRRAGSTSTIALHTRFGFSQVGYFTEQGRKFGRYWDVAWYEKPMP